MIFHDAIEFLKSPAEGFQIFFVIALGLCVGSFLNVVIFRLPRAKSIVSPGSRCGFCRSAIDPVMNIPVLSFILNGGACSKCGHHYSARYPSVECLNAVLFFVIWSMYGWKSESAVYGAFSSLLLAMSFIDLEFRIIPDAISLGGWSVALFLSITGAAHLPISGIESVAGSLFGYILFWTLSRAYAFLTGEEGLGQGDVKLMGLIGAVLGFRGVLTTILVGSLLGALVGVSAILIFKRTKKFPIPFGPFLALGAYAALFRLDEIWWP